MSHEVVTRNAPVEPAPGDLQLVLEATAGDFDAFEQLVGRYQTFVRATVARTQVERDVLSSTDDLTQLVWEKAWKGLSGFRHESAFSTWLYSIVKTTVSNARRSHGRRPQTGPFATDEYDSDVVGDAADGIPVWLALDALDDLERCALLNRELHGLTWEENVDTCSMLLGQHLSLWDVREAHRRAKVRLRHELGDQ